MKRQFGAVAFDIDAISGYAEFSIPAPQALSREVIVDAFTDANYEAKIVKVQIRGSVDADGKAFVAEGTGQRFELAALNRPPGWSGVLDGRFEPSGEFVVADS